ncbi:MAG: hypothetical protein H0V09_10640 [Gemmatimonadetes bacterium]|nr:hypothetical protein [Gemmatimonadota bacterium]
MARALRVAGVPVTLLELPEGNHSIPRLSADPAHRLVTCTALRFLEATIGPPTGGGG